MSLTFSRDYVRAELRRWNRDISSADNLVKRPRLVTEHPTSQNVKDSRRLASMSLGELMTERQLARYQADPKYRAIIREIQSLADSPKKSNF